MRRKLLKKKVLTYSNLDEKSIMRMFLNEALDQLRGLNLLAIKQLTTVCKNGYSLHMIDDYETLISQKEKENLALIEVLLGDQENESSEYRT